MSSVKKPLHIVDNLRFPTLGEAIDAGKERAGRVLGSMALFGVSAMQGVTDVAHRAVGNDTYRQLWVDNRLDHLTGTISRRRIVKEIKQYADSTDQHEFVGAFVDVVGLSEVNNTYTHDMGDNLLRVAGWGLKQLFHLPEQDMYRGQPSALVGRWGGDEFIALMPADVPLFDHLGKSMVFGTLHELEGGESFGEDRHTAVWNLKDYYSMYINNENNRHIKPDVRSSIKSLLDAGVDEIKFAYNIGDLTISKHTPNAIGQFMAKYSSKYARRAD